MKIIIEAEAKEVAALITELTKEQPRDEYDPLRLPSTQTSKSIKGITISIDPFEKSAIHDTQQE